MIVFLNGRFVPEREAVISVNDRGFLYGDGLFETIRVCRSRAFRIAQHLARLAQGAETLKIKLPIPPQDLQRHAQDLISRNGNPEAVLRITLSRGPGERGYSPRGADQPTLVMTLHPAPALDPEQPHEWTLITSSNRIPAGDALAAFKTASKLVNVRARMEAEEQGANEALLLNTQGDAAETASANLFWICNRTIFTPALAAGILPGITRAVILEICARLGLSTNQQGIKPDALRLAEAIFLTQSALGVIAVTSLDGKPFTVPPVVHQIHRAYCELLTT